MANVPGYDDGLAARPTTIDLRSTAEGVELVWDGAGAVTQHDDAGVRPWIGVHFECCGVYSRIYRERTADRYEGRCPKCAAPITVRVSPDGVSTSVVRARVV